MHLIVPQSVINESLDKDAKFPNFKDLCVSCLNSVPSKLVDFETFKKMLFDRYKDKLSLKDSSSADYDEYLKTETGRQELKKVEARIAKLLQRNDQVFYKSPKIYGAK